MLKITVSIIPGGVGKERQLGVLHIANVSGGAIADYRCSISSDGTDETVGMVRRYPRWSAPVWDLVARAIATVLSGRERLPRRPAPIRVPVLTDPGTGAEYVRIEDIPKHARDTFLRQLRGRERPVIGGEAECALAADWRHFIALGRDRS